MKNRRPSKRELELEVENWNLKYPIGTKVTVTFDDGSWRETTTTSLARILSGHTPVIFLDGVSGCYLLSRVRVS